MALRDLCQGLPGSGQFDRVWVEVWCLWVEIYGFRASFQYGLRAHGLRVASDVRAVVGFQSPNIEPS